MNSRCAIQTRHTAKPSHSVFSHTFLHCCINLFDATTGFIACTVFMCNRIANSMPNCRHIQRHDEICDTALISNDSLRNSQSIGIILSFIEKSNKI